MFNTALALGLLPFAVPGASAASMSGFESQALALLSNNSIPGLAVAATSISNPASNHTNTTSPLTYTFAAGTSPTNQSITLDSPMFIASCTKLATTIAVLQLVERGLLSLDRAIDPFLPELARLDVLQLYSLYNVPAPVPPAVPITLRALLTHSSGVTYPGIGLSPAVDKYWAATNGSAAYNGTVLSAALAPLAFRPSSAWSYGHGLDLAGVLVARAANTSLEAYFQEHILRPLGCDNTTFSSRLRERPELSARVVAMASRDADGALGLLPRSEVEFAGYTDEWGGSGLVSTVGDYLRILRSLLVPGQVLSAASIGEMFTPQLGVEAREAYMSMAAAPGVKYTFGAQMVPETPKTWGLGGVLPLADDPVTGKKKFTLTWSGLPNLYWFANLEEGIVGIFGMQLEPTNDEVAGELAIQFEREVTAMFREQKAQRGT